MMATLVIIAVAAIAIVVLLAHKPSQGTASPSATGKGKAGTASGAAAAVGQAKAAASGPAIFSGPVGVEARWVIQENDKPGTTAWEIHGAHGGISGFASQVYAQPGQ